MNIDFQTREKIRDAYKGFDLTPKNQRIVSPYSVPMHLNWEDLMSPIESLVWCAIRHFGLPLYPQYPVDRFFLDFGDPWDRIGIEVDSVRWHQDIEKDRRRQREIEKLGWHVYRIPSHMTFRSFADFQDEQGEVDQERYVDDSAEGFLRDLYKPWIESRERVFPPLW